MAKINTYSVTGTKTGSNLPKAFQEKVNLDLLAQAVRVYQDRSHPGLSKVKTRGEVRASTAKIWRQKGTGKARHGSISAPIFVGGGIAHGPKGIKRELVLSKKMARKALLSALSLKAKEGKVVVVNNLSGIKKTKEAQKLINSILSKEGIKDRVNLGVVVQSAVTSAKLSFRNIKNVEVADLESLNTLKVLTPNLLVFDKDAIEAFGKVKKDEVVKERSETKPVKSVAKPKLKVAKKRVGAKKVAKKGTK
jgi:large subunit ribosomal protein L4